MNRVDSSKRIETAVFLDRDGVINRNIDGDYVRHWQEFEFLPGSHEAIQRLLRENTPIIVVCNQACIGKGLVSDAMVQEINRRLVSQTSDAGLCNQAAIDLLHRRLRYQPFAYASLIADHDDRQVLSQQSLDSLAGAGKKLELLPVPDIVTIYIAVDHTVAIQKNCGLHILSESILPVHYRFETPKSVSFRGILSLMILRSIYSRFLNIRCSASKSASTII